MICTLMKVNSRCISVTIKVFQIKPFKRMHSMKFALKMAPYIWRWWFTKNKENGKDICISFDEEISCLVFTNPNILIYRYINIHGFTNWKERKKVGRKERKKDR